MLYEVSKGDESFLEKIKLHTNGKQVGFLLLGRIMIEFHNIKKLNYVADSNPVKVKHVKTKLQGYGKVIEDNLSEKQIEWAKQFESKKHMNSKGIPLSIVDCKFLKYALDNPHMVVVTHDRLLQNIISRQNSAIRTFDPIRLQIS